MITTERGSYRFPALPPGAYKVTYSLQGFRTLVRENVRITIGATVTIDESLDQSSISENITVTAASPVVDLQRTTLSANITKEILQALPVARNVGTFFNMAPGVTADTVHGSGERDNTYNIDGVNVTDRSPEPGPGASASTSWRSSRSRRPVSRPSKGASAAAWSTS